MTRDERNQKLEDILRKFVEDSPAKGEWWPGDLEQAKAKIEALFKEQIE